MMVERKEHEKLFMKVEHNLLHSFNFSAIFYCFFNVITIMIAFNLRLNFAKLLKKEL